MKTTASTLLKSASWLVMACAVAPAAFAQQAPAVDGTAQAAPAAEEGKVEEVVVTAQFRRQNLQRTPIAITAVSGEMLAARSQVSIADVAAQTPSVTLKPNSANYGSSLAANIRGVGQFDFHPALEPGVGVYVDDVYYSTLTGSILDLLDLDRVEVLRGPQGTLAGKNSIGGAIKLYSKRPTGNNSGYISGTYGSANRFDLRGAVDLGITQDLSLRLTGVTRTQDGYIERRDYGCDHPGEGIPATRDAGDCVLSRQGEVGYWATRGALRYKPSSNFEINIIGDYTSEKHEIAGGVLTYANYKGAGDVNPFATAIPFDSRFICGRYCNYSSYTSPADGALQASTIPGRLSYTGWGVSGQFEWKLADNVQLVGITAYRKYDETFSNEDDLSPMSVVLGGPNNVYFHAWSNELRLTGDMLGHRLHYTIGGYMIDQKSFYVSRQDIRYAVPALVFVSGDPVPANSRAAFVHAAYDLTDQLTVTGGLRYTKEEKNYTFRRRDRAGNLLGGQYTTLDGKTGNYSGDNVDYRANVSYQITPRINTYAQWSTGFKGGGVNPRPYAASQVVTFNPETLSTWEVGVKSDLFDRRVRLNLAAYTSKYKDIQLTLNSCPQYNPPGVTIPCAMPANVGTARIKGFEAESSVRLFDGFMLDAAASYTDFTYKSIDPQAGGAGNPNGVQYGMVPPYTPKWKWSAGVQYQIGIGSTGSITPRFDISYQSRIWGAAVNSARTQINAYTLANARLTWRNAKRDIEASLEVTNLFDTYYYLTASEVSVTTGVANAQPGRPRQWAMTLKKSF
jgi:iron complex outermembrane receptor protein